MSHVVKWFEKSSMDILALFKKALIPIYQSLEYIITLCEINSKIIFTLKLVIALYVLMEH